VNAARTVAGVRLLWSVVLLAAPKTVLGTLAPKERSSPRARGVVMVLGARNLMQAGIELAHPSRPVLGVAAGVDAIHAVTFVGLATTRPDARWGRAALINVLTALAFCAATTTSVIAIDEKRKPEPAQPPQPQRAELEESKS
jgi:hypothetical protein